MSETPILCLAIIFFAGLVSPLVKKINGEYAGYILSVAPFAVFIMLALASGEVAKGKDLFYSIEWFGALGVTLDLRIGGLGLVMATLVSGIGGFIVIYTQGYLHGHPQLGRFYLYLFLFMGAMLGLVLSDNLILLFVFWELTSITSYLLIGFKHEYKDSRWKALQALLVTGLGAMAMLVGFILLSRVTGTYRISEINGMGELIRSSPFYTAIVILLLGGAFTKSAQIPFHFWLPNAMAGPTPVSAFLHSATMVKAGIFLMALLTPAVGGSALWNGVISSFGGATLLLAVCLGLFQKDVKAVLAYTTLAVLGLLTMLLGIGTPYAFKAMIILLIGHALYKATLFMVAGTIDHETGTRDATLLRGLRGLMPITAIAGGLAALSMSGIPPFFGFAAKELIYKTGLSLTGAELSLLVVALVGNLLMMALALNAGVHPFWGKPNHDALPKKPHEAPFAFWIGPVVLGSAGLLFGVLPFLIADTFIAPAVAAIEGADKVKPIDITLWHLMKPGIPLLLSCITIAGGLLVFLLRRKFWSVSESVLAAIRPYGSEAMYDRIFYGVVAFSKWQTKRLQTGRLHDYVFVIASATAVLVVWALFSFPGYLPAIDLENFDFGIAMLVILMAVASFMAVRSDRYFLILGALGTVGFGVALIFAYYGAPDLAITQLMVEALTVVLFMFVIHGLPPIRQYSDRLTTGRDFTLSLVFGLVIACLAWLAVKLNFGSPISETLAAMSYPEAKGKNIVNVILVDFRALDTFGEITVVASAAIGIAALMGSRISKKLKKEGK